MRKIDYSMHRQNMTVKSGKTSKLLLFRTRLVFSFDDIQELLNVQNSLGTRQQAPLSEDNETSMEGLLQTGRLCSLTGVFVVPLSYWNILTPI